MSLPVMTAAGNLTADPELRFTQQGTPVANFTVACSERRQDDQGVWQEGAVTFVRVTCWRSLAEHVAGSLTKGSGVVVAGKLTQSDYETREGEKRTSFELLASDVAASLRYATAVLTRTGARRETTQADDAWGAPAAASTGRRAASAVAA